MKVLNDLDKRVIYELDITPKTSLTKLAKKLRINRNTLEYRIDMLMKNEVIKNFFAIINGFNLGFKYYKYFIKTKRIHENFSQEELFKVPQVVWMGKTDGYWDFAITIKAKNDTELTEILKKINSLFELKEKSLLLINKAIVFNERWLTTSNEIKEIVNELNEEQKIDNVDKKLLNILCSNSRESLVDMANKVNLTPEAVAKRIKLLHKSKIIVGYKIRINYSLLGYEYYHLLISLSNENTKKNVVNFLKYHKNCITILELQGAYDIQTEFIAKSYQEMQETIEKLKEKFSNEIEHIERLFIINESKIKTV